METILLAQYYKMHHRALQRDIIIQGGNLLNTEKSKIFVGYLYNE
jgi:hypothetical protein